MTHPSSAFVWILLGLPLVIVLVGLFMFLTRWLRLRPRSGGESEELLLGAVSQSLQERGRLAASLGELRTVHERLLDALPSGILWVDQRQRVAALNGPGLALLGVKPGVIGLDARFVLEPFPWLLAGLGQAPGAAWRCDGGGRRWRLRRIEAPDMVGTLLEFEDITEWEQDERRRQLRDRFAELGEMTAGVAHQLKNSLAVLKGHGQLLQRAGQLESAQAVLEETDTLERLVQRFLQWAKPLEPQCVELDLEEAAAQAVAEVGRRPALRDRTVTVTGQGRALADPMLLHQALVNLLENAAQATPVGSRVQVLIADGLLEILDEGPGLDPESAARMLKPFESGRPDGTGLGLPLALKWLNVQGADLVIGLRPEGGSRLTVRW
ncbi:MAG: ATP-binding protein [Holophaga sp.]|nr:ATP-binding protein [Holophaga sp.]